MVHDGLEPLRAPAIPAQDAVIETLAKNVPTAKNTITPKPTRQDRKLYPSSTERQICWPAPIAALHTPATAPAARADSPWSARSKQDLHPVRQNLHRIYCKTTRRKACALKTMLHPLILLRTSANLVRNSSKCESEPILHAETQVLSFGVVRNYDLVVAMTNGGPGNATEVPAKFVMDYLFERQNTGMASAGAVILLTMVLGVAAPIWYVQSWRARRTAALQKG